MKFYQFSPRYFRHPWRQVETHQTGRKLTLYHSSRKVTNVKPQTTDQVHNNVEKYFLHHEILCDNQQRISSCETQLITTLQCIASQLHLGKDQVDVILLDFSNAFDKVHIDAFYIS